MTVRAVSCAFLLTILCAGIVVAKAGYLSHVDLSIALGVSIILGLTSIVAKNKQAIEIASHALVISLLTFIYIICFRNAGVVTPPIVALTFLPALCAKLFRPLTCLTYTGIIIVGLIFLLYVSKNGTFRAPHALEYVFTIWLCMVSSSTAFISIYVVTRSNNLSKTLKYQSERDFLTGLPNRYKIHERLFQDIAQANRTGTYASVMMIDVDRFKDYNDRNGHLAGDAALVNVANLLKEIALDEKGFVGRYGGEEFIFSIVGADRTEFLGIAENLRQSISEMILEISPSRSESLTITVGVATNIEVPGINYEVLIQNADLALYKGKARGRNRVEIFEATNQPSTTNSLEGARKPSKSATRIKPKRPHTSDLIDGR